jgi:hypothetical protein
MSTAKESEIRMTKELAAKIKRGAKLTREVSSLEKKSEELNALKKEFRELAGELDLELKAPNGCSVFVEQKQDAIVRAVPDESISKVRQLSSDKLTVLFSLHPRKGDEANVELNIHKHLPKQSATALIDELTASATAWVRFREK